MTIRRLAHINLTTPAEQEVAVLAFYEQSLGLPRKPKPASQRQSGGWFALGDDLELHISVDAIALEEQRANPRHVALWVDGLAELRERLLADGHPVLPDRRPLAGIERFFTVDPAGNRLELMAETP
ncbi:MAG: hypothetical protein RLO50_17060 [Azospirillaceae bacterium]